MIVAKFDIACGEAGELKADQLKQGKANPLLMSMLCVVQPIMPNAMETRPSMIGSPERVKIQRSLVQNLSKIQQRIEIIGCFFGGVLGGLKYPRGHNKFWGSN